MFAVREWKQDIEQSCMYAIDVKSFKCVSRATKILFLDVT